MPALHWVLLGSALGGMLFLALGLCFAWHWKKGPMIAASCAALAAFAVCVRAGEVYGRAYALGDPLWKSDVKLGVVYDVVGGVSAISELTTDYSYAIIHERGTDDDNLQLFVSQGYLPCRAFTVVENEHRLRELHEAPGKPK